MSGSGGGRLVVVTFKCSVGFKGRMDKFSELFESRSDMIRCSILTHMRVLGEE